MPLEEGAGREEPLPRGPSAGLEIAPAGGEEGGRRAKGLIFLAVPCLFLVFQWASFSRAGPFWFARNWDPETVYVFSSMRLAMGHAPGHTDHPGTTVQALGAVLFRAVHLAGDKEEFEKSVLSDPDRYLSVARASLFVLASAVLFWLGVFARRLTGSLAAGLLMQLSVAASPTLLLAFKTFRPEPMLVCIGAAAAALLLASGLKGESMAPARLALWWAAVCGLGVATKLTFLPVLLVPLVGLRGFRARGVLLLGFAGTLLVATLPVAVHWPRMTEWAWSLFANTGKYGTGEAGFAHASLWMQNMFWIFRNEPMLPFVTASAAAVVVALGVQRLRGGAAPGGEARWLCGALVAVGFAWVLMAKRQAYYYLIPANALAGGILLLSVEAAKALMPSERFRARAVQAFVILCIAVLAVRGARTSVRELARMQKDIEAALVARAAFERMHTDPSEGVILYFGTSHPAIAYRMANEYCDRAYSSRFERLYPGMYFFEPWTQKVYDWRGLTTFEEIRKRHPKILFFGKPFVGSRKRCAPFPLRTLLEAGDDVLSVPADAPESGDVHSPLRTPRAAN